MLFLFSVSGSYGEICVCNGYIHDLSEVPVINTLSACFSIWRLRIANIVQPSLSPLLWIVIALNDVYGSQVELPVCCCVILTSVELQGFAERIMSYVEVMGVLGDPLQGMALYCCVICPPLQRMCRFVHPKDTCYPFSVAGAV